MKPTPFTEFLVRNDLSTPAIISEVGVLEMEINKTNFTETIHAIAAAVFCQGEVLPAWIVGEDPIMFSGYKFFDRTPMKDVKFNKQGGHVFRRVMARHARNIRMRKLQLDRRDLQIKENYFSTEQHVRLKESIETFPKFENKQPDNMVAAAGSGGIALYTFGPIFASACHFLGYETNDRDVLEYFINMSYVQRLNNIRLDGDIQKVIHSDVFFPCMKYWWFPDDVTRDDGCFWYAKGSTNLTPKILDWHYEMSCQVAAGTWSRARNKGHGEGSFRAFHNELDAMELKIEPVEVKANTLIMADTSGFHCRGEPTNLFLRQAIHGAIRMDDCFKI